MHRNDTSFEYTKRGDVVVFNQSTEISANTLIMEVEHVHTLRGESFMGDKGKCNLCRLIKSREGLLGIPNIAV